MTLGQSLAITAQDGRQVGKLRQPPTEGLVNSYLPGSVRDVVVTANDVGDLHERIVDGNHVVVDRDAGRTNQNKVTHGLACKLDVTAHDVVEAQGRVGHRQTHSEALACGGSGFRF